MSEIKVKKFLTTGEVAKHCGVHFRTVLRWIENGYLKAMQLPGRGDNRIRIEDFLAFLNKNNMEIPTPFSAGNSTRRVLIVEDDPQMMRSIKRSLEALGLICDVAEDGFQAGALLVQNKPFLMTLDLQMPGLGGLGVIKLVRKEMKLENLFVLVISGMEESQLKKAMQLGANDYLKKPFTKQELEKKIFNFVPDLREVKS